MDSGERGMNSLAMTIIDHRKEYWRLEAATSCSQVLYATDLAMRTRLIWSEYLTEYVTERIGDQGPYSPTIL